jgi:hypothetical protein
MASAFKPSRMVGVVHPLVSFKAHRPSYNPRVAFGLSAGLQRRRRLGNRGTRPDARPGRLGFLAWPLVFALGFFPLTMLFTRWPLRLAFLASAPAMDRLADRVAAGRSVTSPEWAGLFRVVGSAVEPSNGNVGLIIDPDPSGRSGFVRLGAPGGVPAGRAGGPFYDLYLETLLG